MMKMALGITKFTTHITQFLEFINKFLNICWVFMIMFLQYLLFCDEACANQCRSTLAAMQCDTVLTEKADVKLIFAVVFVAMGMIGTCCSRKL